jgi:putative transposase
MLEPGLYYHIYNRANGSENLFRTDENYYFFLKKYAEYINPIAETYAYCLMPNHFHFLIRVRDVETLLLLPTFGKFKTFQKLNEEENLKFNRHISKQFSNLFSSYTQSYNKVYNRKGSLFIPNFKKKHINNDHYFTKAIHYIHANPVHHKFCKDIHDWKHSSFHSLLSTKPTQLYRDEVIKWFGNIQNFTAFHQQPIDIKMALELE